MLKGLFGTFKAVAVAGFGKTISDYGTFDSVAGSNFLAVKLKQDRQGTLFVILRMSGAGRRSRLGFRQPGVRFA